MTKKEYFAAIREYVADNAELVAFVDHEMELLNKKRTSVNTKAKAEIDARMEKVYNALAEMDEPVTPSELKKLTSDAEVAEYNTQRITAMLTRLGDRVVKTTVKRVNRWSIA